VHGTHAALMWYLRGQFTLDLLCTFPYHWLAWLLEPHSMSAGLVRMLRVAYPILPMIRSLASTFAPKFSLNAHPGMLRVAHLIRMMFLACHLCGCIWWMVGIHQSDQPRDANSSWGPTPWLRLQPFFTQYVHAALWGVSGASRTGASSRVLPPPPLSHVNASL
jgi:hypothetical protein